MKARYWAPLALALLAIAGWRIYQNRSRERIPSPEGIEDAAIAAGFNRVARWPPMRVLRWLAIRRATALTSQGQAADLGCGPGYLVVELARQAPGLHVTGVDLSDEMLAAAERFASRAGLGDSVAFRKGDAAEIPFPDASLDLVVSTLSLHHWSDPVAVLDEIARVLRAPASRRTPGREAGFQAPGGAFMVLDLRRDLAPPFYLLLWFVTRFIVPPALRRAREPLGSRNAAYTAAEAAGLAQRSRLTASRVKQGRLFLTIEGKLTL
jgi:ubiquinone/menaquinone biosynthesis C-methylase UbiE